MYKKGNRCADRSQSVKLTHRTASRITMLRFCTVVLAMGCCSAAPLWREKRGDDMQEKIALTGFKGGLVVLKDVLDSVGSACGVYAWNGSSA